MVTPSSFNTVSKGKPMIVKVSLTVPIICQGGGPKCQIAVHIVSPRKDIVVSCPNALVFTAATWNVVQTVTIKTKTDTKHVGVLKVAIKVIIIPQPTVLSLLSWKQHRQMILTVSIFQSYPVYDKK